MQISKIKEYMIDSDELKKFGADKIVFLGMFIAALLLAQLIVSVRSAVAFSEPVVLPHTGLSVPMPIGKNWQTDKQWQFDGTDYTLSSNFMARRGVPAAIVQCQYSTTSEDITPKVWLEQQIDDPNNSFIESEKIQRGNLTIRWAHVEKPVTIFFGMADLPNNRTFSVQVVQTTPEIDLAERVFKKIINSFEYKDDNPVQAGAEIIADLKSKGLDALIEDRHRQAYFFIQDSTNHNLGFTVDFLDDSGTDEQSPISGASQLVLTGLDPQEQVSFFKSDKNLASYSWQSQTRIRADRGATKIVLDGTGTINVTKSLNRQSRARNYPNSASVVPTIFLELVLDQVVQKDVKEAIVDTIDSGGKIAPVLISCEPADKNNDKASNKVTLEFLDGEGSSELVYLADDNTISRIELHQDREYFLERTGLENIKAEFPRQAGDILQQNQILDEDVL